MATAPMNRQQLRDVLRSFSATGEDLAQQFASATDSTYWIRLFSQCSIESDAGGEMPWESPSEVNDEQIEHAIAVYQRQGWLALSGALSEIHLQKMRSCVEAVRKAGWPPVFSYVYDDFWLVGRSRTFRRLLMHLLGAEYVFLPRVWTHFVYPAEGNAGWKPHIDDSGSTRNISVWVPLSEATLSNGCMYVVRRNEATEVISDQYTRIDTFTKRQVNALLQSVRALPASPGQILCWNEHVVHWGSMAEPLEGNQPRISIALEFSTNAFPVSKEVPFVVPNTGPLPKFDARLRSICRAILSYRRFEMLAERFVPLAEMILKEAR